MQFISCALVCSMSEDAIASALVDGPGDTHLTHYVSTGTFISSLIKIDEWD